MGIIGGGVHGASAAFHLAGRGVSTVLLERGDAAGGPSGRSSAVCRAYYTNPFLARVARESLDMFAAFAEHTGGGDAGFRAAGALFLHGPEDADAVAQTAARLNAIGTEVDVLDVDGLAAEFPRVDVTGLACGAWERRAGYADPAQTTTSLLAAARRDGADVRLHTGVAAVAARGGSVSVRLEDGSTVDVGRLLIAAGPWTRPLAAQVGADLPLTVERHGVGAYGWGDAEPVPHAIADVVHGYYGRPEVGGLYLLGSLLPAPSADPDAFDERFAEDESMALLDRFVARIPSLEDVRPRGGWASLYDVSPDWQPVIGEIAEGVFVDAGTSGHGFKLAPALGRHVADLVLGDPDPDLAQFSPERFATGASVAAGWGDARILG